MKKETQSHCDIFRQGGAQKNWSNVPQRTFKNNPVLTEIISMETLPEKFKLIASEDFEFQSRQKK